MRFNLNLIKFKCDLNLIVTKYTQTPHWWADGCLKAEKYL